MNRILFPDVYTDDEAYLAAVAYWERMVERIAIDHLQSGEWKPWGLRTYANGTPFPRDGGAITLLCWRNQDLNRAVEVLQWPPSSEDPRLEMSAWIKDTLAPAGDELLPVHVLMLNLILTDESASIAEALISAWMEPGNDPAMLKRLIETRLGPGE